MYASDLSIQVVTTDVARTLFLAGELHLANIDQLVEAVPAGNGPLVIDTTGLDFIDSAGAEALTGIRERVGASHCKLVLGERTLHVLRLAGLSPDFLPAAAPQGVQAP